MSEPQHIWGETEDGYASRVKAHDESLNACLAEIRKRRAAVAELAWGKDGPRLGLLDVDTPKWMDVDHLLEVIDRREWRPIATAPKDGTSILVGHPRNMAQSVRWMISASKGASDGWWFVGGYDGRLLTWEPTHWMPLPDPPKSV